MEITIDKLEEIGTISDTKWVDYIHSSVMDISNTYFPTLLEAVKMIAACDGNPKSICDVADATRIWNIEDTIGCCEHNMAANNQASREYIISAIMEISYDCDIRSFESEKKYHAIRVKISGVIDHKNRGMLYQI